MISICLKVLQFSAGSPMMVNDGNLDRYSAAARNIEELPPFPGYRQSSTRWYCARIWLQGKAIVLI